MIRSTTTGGSLVRVLPRPIGGRGFFSALKKGRIRCLENLNRPAASSDVIDYIEAIYNLVRRHDSAGDLSSVELKRRFVLSGH
jgi:hypothetical protein